MKESLGRWTVGEYISSLIRGLGGNHMAPGSSNAMVSGENFIRAFRGVTALAGKVGARLHFNTDQNYAGLGDAADEGAGSVFNVRQLLSYVGAGQVTFAGLVLTGIIANSTLSFVKKAAGVYAAGSATGPFQAGHAQPSPPTIYPKSSPSANQTPITGTVALVCWRISDITGQVSLASLPSNVLTLSNGSFIAQVPLPDTNGQTHFGFGVPKIGFDELGVFIALPTSLRGEVAEADLAYTREIGSATILNATNVVDAAGGNFTSADIGRRIASGAFDSWITAINSGTQVQVNDTNSAGDITADATITHAVDGITRAVELSYSNGALQGQPLVPDKAFPPPALQFAGVMRDTLWGDAEGIIYIGEPGFIGSFPPSSAQFANEPAVAYLSGIDGLTLRFGKHSWGALVYVGGSPAIQYQEISSTLGIAYPQNVAMGARGRLLAWFGKPTVIESNSEPDYEYAVKVMPDFEGWDAGQTADAPIVPGYDERGDYEVWCWQKKVRAKYVPKDWWCAPIDLTDKVSGNIVAAVTHKKQLYLSCSDGEEIAIYQFDVGSGSVMVVQTSDVRPNGYGATISEVLCQGRVDNIANPVIVEVVKNFDDANPIEVLNRNPTRTGTQDFFIPPPNILDARQHALRLTMTSEGGDTGLDFIETKGELNEVIAA